MPPTIFISVDLPAPFSPSSATTSPAQEEPRVRIALDLGDEQRIDRAQHQPPRVVHEQLDPAKASDVVFDVGEDVAGQIELAVAGQRGDDFGGGRSRGGGVPQRQRRDAVGMDVFGAFLQFGVARQFIARRLVVRIIHFQQDGSIALHDQRIGRVIGHAGDLVFLRTFAPEFAPDFQGQAHYAIRRVADRTVASYPACARKAALYCTTFGRPVPHRGDLPAWRPPGGGFSAPHIQRLSPEITASCNGVRMCDSGRHSSLQAGPVPALPIASDPNGLLPNAVSS
jgi:hypothetical protein